MLKTHNLTAFYGDFQALKKVTLDIRARIDPALVERIEEKLKWTPSSSRSWSAR